MPSSPLPPAAAARAALAGLTPPRPARAPPAGPGRAAAASAPHLLPGRRGGEDEVRVLSPPRRGPQRWAAAARAPPPPPLPHTPPAPLYLRGTRARRRRRADRAGRQLSVRSPAGRVGAGGVVRREGEGQREEGGTQVPTPPPHWGKERVAVAIPDAHAH